MLLLRRQVLFNVAVIDGLCDHSNRAKGKSQHNDCVVDDEGTDKSNHGPAKTRIELTREASEAEEHHSYGVEEHLVHDVLLVDEPVFPLVLVARDREHSERHQKEDNRASDHQLGEDNHEKCVEYSSHHECHHMDHR